MIDPTFIRDNIRALSDAEYGQRCYDDLLEFRRGRTRWNDPLRVSIEQLWAEAERREGGRVLYDAANRRAKAESHRIRELNRAPFGVSGN